MSSANFNYFIRADITLATLSAGVLSTITISVVNKPLKDSSSVGTFWPILQSVGDISFAAGEFLPNVSVSGITLNNAIGSLGAGRKFSDLLQRYTLVQQPVTLYIGQVANDTDTVSSWVTGPTVKMESYEHAANGGELTINVTPIRFDERVLTLEVSRTISSFESAPDSSLGKAVPLVFGTGNAVVPVRISPDDSNLYIGAIATGLHGHLQNDTSTAVFYTRNFVDEWEQVTSTKAPAFNNTGSPNTGVYTLNTYPEAIFNASAGNGLLVQGITLTCKPNGLASSTARLKVAIYRIDTVTKNVIEEVTSGQADLAIYNTQNNSTLNPDFSINIAFDRVAMLSTYSPNVANRYFYGIGISVTNWQSGDLSLRMVGTSRDAYIRSTTDSAAGFTFRYTTLNDIKINLINLEPSYANQYLGTPTSTGLNYSSITLTTSAFDSGQTAPPLDTLPVLVGNFRGLGVASGLTPNQIARRLTWIWDGSSWADPNVFNETELSSHYAALFSGTSYRSRTVAGVIEARTTVAQALAELAKGSVSRVGIASDGRQFLYPWGFTATPAAEIPACDITPLSWEQRDISTVVNDATISVGRSPLFSGTGVEDRNQVDGYQYTTIFNRSSFAYIFHMLTESVALYGSRPLDDGLYNLWPRADGSGSGTYLGSSTAEGSLIAEYLFARFGKPAVYATFIVPWHRYSSLKMFDVINFQHPEFPAFYGTDPEPAMPAVNTGTTVERTDPAKGYEFVRAQTYRGLIEGVSYVLNMEHAPAIKLTVLVLLNQPWDPT